MRKLFIFEGIILNRKYLKVYFPEVTLYFQRYLWPQLKSYILTTDLYITVSDHFLKEIKHFAFFWITIFSGFAGQVFWMLHILNGLISYVFPLSRHDFSTREIQPLFHDSDCWATCLCETLSFIFIYEQSLCSFVTLNILTFEITI